MRIRDGFHWFLKDVPQRAREDAPPGLAPLKRMWMLMTAVPLALSVAHSGWWALAVVPIAYQAGWALCNAAQRLYWTADKRVFQDPEGNEFLLLLPNFERRDVERAVEAGRAEWGPIPGWTVPIHRVP